MKYPEKCFAFILLAAIAALSLRLPQLDARPMHGDEAVNALKFAELLQKGSYRYDPNEHHGPTLNYLTLLPARFTSARSLSDISELTLRIVPVFFVILLILLLLMLADGLGQAAVIIAAVLTAVSPAFVFYSRYYIHEMLLVCFTFGAIASGYRYTRNRNFNWAVLTGVFLGLMHATKETSVIAFASMLPALLLTLLMMRKTGASVSDTLKKIKLSHLIATIAAAVIVSALFYSSFFKNPHGILDSAASYATYFNRGFGNSVHNHPWYYYLKLLIYSGSPQAQGPLWSEGLIVFLAAVGFIAVLTRKGIAGVNIHLLRFIAFYTAVMTVLYSAIPYKTPWCLLSFLHGLILLAAIGAVVLTKLASNVLPRLIICLILITAGLHLTFQACRAAYTYSADPANPYVYAHSTADVVTIAGRLEQIARIHPDARNMHIQVICPADDYWPLPWYLRGFTSVGYFRYVDINIPAAPVIIVSANLEDVLAEKLYELPPGGRNLYVPLFDRYMQLRPGVYLQTYITKDLRDTFQHHQP